MIINKSSNNCEVNKFRQNIAQKRPKTIFFRNQSHWFFYSTEKRNILNEEKIFIESKANSIFPKKKLFIYSGKLERNLCIGDKVEI